jgi:biopolymer transport protein ExbD
MGMQLGNQPLHTNEPEVMMEINTTPLIDVMLVLLIMLIITIPAQLHSVNLDLPVAAPPTKKVEPVVIKIEVDANNQIAWNGKALASREELQSKLQEASQREPQPELHVRSHAKAKYETTMAVMANAQRLGLKKLGIVGAEQIAY